MEQQELKEKARVHIEHNPLCTLATIGDNGMPQLSSVYVFIESDFSCYFITKTESRKFKNIQARSFATLLSSSEAELLSVEIEGTALQVADTLQVVQVTDRFRKMITERKGNYWEPPIAQIQSGHYVVCKLSPVKVNISMYADTVEGIDGPQSVSLSTSEL